MHAEAEGGVTKWWSRLVLGLAIAGVCVAAVRAVSRYLAVPRPEEKACAAGEYPLWVQTRWPIGARENETYCVEAHTFEVHADRSCVVATVRGVEGGLIACQPCGGGLRVVRR